MPGTCERERVSDYGMWNRWSVIFPVVGLLLFGAITLYSYRTQRGPSKYFYWSSIRLDSDPANRRAPTTLPCKDGRQECSEWDLTIADRWIDPGILEIVLIVAALPAFIVGGISVAGLGRLGINQVSSFLVLMPILIFMWFHFVGRLVDRLFGNRVHARS
jgi:hypothetical protein